MNLMLTQNLIILALCLLTSGIDFRSGIAKPKRQRKGKFRIFAKSRKPKLKKEHPPKRQAGREQ